MPTVFISHSSRDRDAVEREIIGPLRGVGIVPWFSEHDIQTSAAWERRIREGLKASEWFLVALTPNSVSSEWVQTEVDWALEHRPNRLIPVLLADCNSDDLHLKLRRLQHVDLRGSDPGGRARLVGAFVDGAGTATPLPPINSTPSGGHAHNAAPPPLPPPPLPQRRRAWPWVVGALAFVVFVVAVVAANEDKAPTDSSPADTTAPAMAPTPASSPRGSSAPRRVDYGSLMAARLDTAMARFSGERAFNDVIDTLLTSARVKRYNIDLNAGTTYTIRGVCDDDCTDLDLAVSYSGAEIAKDRDTDDMPVLVVTPSTSGQHVLMVSLARCTTPFCWFGVRILAR